MFKQHIRTVAVFSVLCVVAALTARLSMAAERGDRQSVATRKHQTLKTEQQRRLAEQTKPLSAAEREWVLNDLKSGSSEKIKKVLKFLTSKNVRPDKEVSKAIIPLLKHKDSLIRYDAKKAIEKFAPDYLRKEMLKREYFGFGLGHISEMGPQVNDETPLPEGLVVAVKDDMAPWYFPAMVLKTSKDKVLVVFKFTKEQRIVNRSDIRLAPPELEQPFLKKKGADGSKDGKEASKNKSSGKKKFPDEKARRNTRPPTMAEQGYRSWADDSGSYTIMAKYVGSDGETVTLLCKKDGKKVKVPLARLSEADREVARRLMAAPKPGNPFE